MDAFVSTGTGILGHNMFAYCGNNPVVYVDKTGTAHVKGTDACGGAIITYNKIKVNATTYYSLVADYWTLGNFFCGIEEGESYTLQSCDYQNADVIFYNQCTFETGSVFDNQVGVNVNIDNGGFRLSTGFGGNSFAICYDNTSYEICLNPSKFAFTVATNVNYRTMSAEYYIQYYLRPIPTAAVVIAAYYCPVIAYPAISYFVTGEGSKIFAY